jgi:hypothetical protein
MKKIDLGQTITILANIGVIAGIGFLALEVHQNNELMSAEARRSRTESSESAFRAIAENADLAEIFVKARQGQEFSAIEEQRFRSFFMGLLVNLQSTFRDLRPEELESILNRYRAYQATLPPLNVVWSENKMNLEPAFVELMDANVFERSE